MNVLYFADLKGQRYAIPEEVLQRHELDAGLPEHERLTGLEIDPPLNNRTHAEPVKAYGWNLRDDKDGQTMEYVVSAPPPAAEAQASRVRSNAITITIVSGEVRIAFESVSAETVPQGGT